MTQKIDPIENPKSTDSCSHKDAMSPIDKVIAALAGSILAADSLTLGLFFLGVITLPFSWPVTVGGGLFLGSVSLVMIFWAINRPTASTSSVHETEETENREEDSKSPIDGIENPDETRRDVGESSKLKEKEVSLESEDLDEEFEEIEAKTPDSFAAEQKASQERKAAQKNDAISQWKKIKQETKINPGKPLPLLLGSRLDVSLEALCKNSDSIVGYIEQSSENGAHNDIENYAWPESQQYLVFGLGIQGLNSRNLFEIGTHWVGGGSIESHQTLVVIDCSDAKYPVLYFYDPKGTEPNERQKDAMYPSQSIPQRLVTIRNQFEKMFKRQVRFEQFHADNPDQNLLNGTDCVYFCAEAAMHITSGKTSQFSKDPKEIVPKVCEQIEQAFPENSQPIHNQ